MIEYLGELYPVAFLAFARTLQRDVSPSRWHTDGPGSVQDGPDLLMLIQLVSIGFQPGFIADLNVQSRELIDLLDRVRFALIVLIYDEEPGELTIEELLADG